MLEFFNGLEIKGRCFENETKLEFFKNDENRIALVFGRNGSGKSTVARAFSTFKDNAEVPGLESVKIVGEITQAELSRVMYIFNEDYVQEKIVLKSGKRGLGSIVLFGEQVDILNEAKACQAKIKDIDTAVKDYNTRLISFFYSLETIADNFPFDNPNLPPEQIFEGFVSRTEWVKRNEAVFGDDVEVVSYYKVLSEMLAVQNNAKPTVSRSLYKSKLQRLRTNLSRPESVMRERVLEQLKKELRSLNLAISYSEFKDEFGKTIDEIKDYLKEFRAVNAQVKEKTSLRKRIASLKKSSRTIKIAADQINASLAYIFMSDKRLRVVPEDGVYKVESNGHPVEPKDISIGERNALAISYFFLDIMTGSEARKAHEQEKLIVLDDPVSSFDHENKMGVLSYILFEMERWRNARFVCLMHDLHSYMALSASIKAYDGTHEEHKIGHTTIKLDCKNGGLDPFPLKDLNEYRSNFENVYDYACLRENELTENCHIGNQMRRILEAYSTFVYRTGIEYLFYGELIRGENAKFYNEFFRARFDRFVVHDESHTQNRILSLADYNSLFPFIKLEERQLAIRESLCLLYLLHPDHVLRMLNKHTSENKVKENMQAWLEKILSSTPALELVL